MNYSKFLIAMGFIAMVAACGKNENNNNNTAGGLTCNGGYTLQSMNGQNLCCPAQQQQVNPYQYGGGYQQMGCVQPTQSCSNGGLFSQTYNQCLVQASCPSGYLSYNNQCITYQQAGASVTNPNTGYTGGGYNYGYGYTNNMYPYGGNGYGTNPYGGGYGMGMYGGAGFGYGGYGMMNPYMMYNPYMYNQNNYNNYNNGYRPY